jgi:hypothetical protein
MSFKSKMILIILIIIIFFSVYMLFIKSDGDKNTSKKTDALHNKNITLTIFGNDGRIIKRWINVKGITADKNGSHTSFHTRDGKYVLMPNSLWYIAEEE